MTEQEAKTKWCPHARIFAAGDYYQSTNGTDMLSMTANDMRPLTRCMASACMAWRWMYGVNQELTVKQNADFEHMQGYCGLAGDPRGALVVLK